jgi:autophagy-related protein 101
MLLSCRGIGAIWRNTDRHEHSCDNNDRHREFSALVIQTHTTPAPTQVLDRQNTREILRALLHAILFHRLFGTIKSQTFEVLDVTMVRVPCPFVLSRLLIDMQPGVADPNVQRLVEEKVNAFWKGLESVALKRGEVRFISLLARRAGRVLIDWSLNRVKIAVTLSKKDQRKAWLGMTTYEARRP